MYSFALRTAAQVAAGFFTADALTGGAVINWPLVGTVAGLSALYSVLTSVAAGTVSPTTGPSFGTETPTNHPNAPYTGGH